MFWYRSMSQQQKQHPQIQDAPSELGSFRAETIQVLDWNIVNKARVDDSVLLDAAKLLNMAAHARESALPHHSNFKVGCALKTNLPAYSPNLSGANSEYLGSFSNATTPIPLVNAQHAEESAVASAIKFDALGRTVSPYGKVYITMSATVTAAPEPSPSCGNCLDTLKGYSQPDTYIVSGTITGNLAVIQHFEDCAPVHFPEILPEWLPDRELRLLQEAKIAAKSGFVPISGDLSGAAVLTSKEIYRGIRRDQADYHCSSALRTAVDHAFCHTDLDINTICYVSKDGLPVGKDRQTIYDVANALQAEDTLRLLLYSTDEDKIYTCSPRELLPFGFGACDIGLESEVQATMSKLREGA